MRHLLVVFIAVLLNVCIINPSGAGTVSIAAPVIKWMTLPEVNVACAAVRPINACTILMNPSLKCTCRNSGGTWRRDARLSAVPVVFIEQSSYLLHEMKHVADFRAMLGDYLRKIESRTFDSAADCAASVARVQAGFSDELVAVRDQSTLKRDGMRVAIATAAGSVRVRDDSVTIRPDYPRPDAARAAEVVASAVLAVPDSPVEPLAP